MHRLFSDKNGEITVGRPRHLVIPTEVTEVRFANSTLRVEEVDETQTPELWSKFIVSVASGYQRYNADKLKTDELNKDPLVTTHHYAIVDTNEQILATCSLQLSNGKGTELTRMFGDQSHVVHETLAATWPGGYGEVKNLTILADHNDPKPSLKEQAILLNALLYTAASNFDKEADLTMREQGLVAVMAPFVAYFIRQAGVKPQELKLEPNQALIPEFIHYFQYFFGPKTFKPIEEGGLLPTEVANRIMEHCGIASIAQLEETALHNPDCPASRDIRIWLFRATRCDPVIPEAYWLTPERLAKAFVPKAYQLNAREVALQAIMNLDSLLNTTNTETVFNQLEKKDAPLDIQSVTERPLYEVIRLDELVSLVRTRKVPVSVIPAEEKTVDGEKVAVKPKSVLNDPRYIKVHLRPATNINGEPYYEERIILLRRPKGVHVNDLDQETLRKIMLVHTLLRALPNLASLDFKPVKDIDWETQIWNYLDLVDTNFAKRADFSVAIAGQGTVGLAPIPGMLMHGFRKIRVCDLPNEIMDMHNIERILQSALSSLGMPKLVLSRAIAQNANPFVDFEIRAQGIYTYEDAFEFIGDSKLVVSALDNPKSMYFLHLAAKAKGIPLLLVTDIAGGAKVQSFNYPEAALFNGLVPDDILTRIQNDAEGAFEPFVAALIGSRKMKKGHIKLIDLIQGLPIQSLRFFANRLEGLIPNLAQDRNSAMVSAAAIELVIATYAETGKLPVQDAIVIPHDKYIEKGPVLARIKERIVVLKRLVAGLGKKS
jgi:hypothetical protein